MLGCGLSLGGAALALTRGRATRSFYAVDVYRLSDRLHRRFAFVSGACALGFLAALHWSAVGIPLLAVYTLLLVLYASSFARGFSEEDE